MTRKDHLQVGSKIGTEAGAEADRWPFPLHTFRSSHRHALDGRRLLLYSRCRAECYCIRADGSTVCSRCISITFHPTASITIRNMSIGRAALTRIGNKPIGPVGYGMLSLSVPWAPTKPSTAVEIMKHALEQGANLWNGVSHLRMAAHEKRFIESMLTLVRPSSTAHQRPTPYISFATTSRSTPKMPTESCLASKAASIIRDSPTEGPKIFVSPWRRLSRCLMARRKLTFLRWQGMRSQRHRHSTPCSFGAHQD